MDVITDLQEKQNKGFRNSWRKKVSCAWKIFQENVMEGTVFPAVA